MLLYAFKTFPISYVIHYYTSMCIPEVCLRYGSESFLTSSIPNLDLNDFLVYF